ncbi:MAG: hypothetical protein O3A63_14935 [Proteobacteria bacterium]|nr:hypothetical protein [Pseudomonadota bacterium]
MQLNSETTVAAEQDMELSFSETALLMGAFLLLAAGILSFATF